MRRIGSIITVCAQVMGLQRNVGVEAYCMVCSLEDFGNVVKEETHRLALLYIRTESKIAFPESLSQHPRMLTSPLCSILPVIAAG